jgi:plastocyanin
MRNFTWKGTGAAALAATGLLLLGACGDDGDDEGTDDTEATGTDADDGGEGGGGGDGGGGLTIAGFAFSEVTAGAGATVAVTNEDGATHTVTSDDDAWEEVSVAGGESGELTAPSEPGDYAFHCEIHSSMTGTLVVE